MRQVSEEIFTIVSPRDVIEVVHNCKHFFAFTREYHPPHLDGRLSSPNWPASNSPSNRPYPPSSSNPSVQPSKARRGVRGAAQWRVSSRTRSSWSSSSRVPPKPRRGDAVLRDTPSCLAGISTRVSTSPLGHSPEYRHHSQPTRHVSEREEQTGKRIRSALHQLPGRDGRREAGVLPETQQSRANQLI
jgi:hypothetical protein